MAKNDIDPVQEAAEAADAALNDLLTLREASVELHEKLRAAEQAYINALENLHVTTKGDAE